MSTSQRVDLKVGPYTITSKDDDTPVMGALQLADGWSITKALDDSQLWPMQETELASFSVYAGEADDVAGITEGARVSIKAAYPRTGGTRISFLGRVTDSVVRAHPLGVVVDVNAIDYRTAELGELIIGDSPWPQEGAIARMQRIMDLCGYTWHHNDPDDTSPGEDPLMKARDVDAQPALGIITNLLDSWARDFTSMDAGFAGIVDRGFARYELVPVINEGGDGSVIQWNTNPRYASWGLSAGDLPGMLGDTTSEGAPGYGVLIPTATGSGGRVDSTVDADYVDLAAAFSQRRGKRPNSVSVRWWSTGGTVESLATRANGLTPVSSFRLDTDLVTAGDAVRAAELYLPDSSGTDWYADGFTWRWYADDYARANFVPEIGDLLVVAPVQLRHNPTGRPWYAGVLTSLVFKMSKDLPVIDLTIKPQLSRFLPSANGLTWNELSSNPDYMGIRWSDLNGRDSWDDYALLRSNP